MDQDERSHLRNLIHQREKRLRALEEQEAQLGLSCPPEIRIEIVDLKARIAELEQQLREDDAADRDVVTPRREPVQELPPPCPYPGMVPFRAEDARFFYGRDSEIQRMLQHLRYHRQLFVIGPSGSGKSSLIHAGLLPRLRTSRYFAEDYWITCAIRPGAQPVQALAQVITSDLTQLKQAVADLIASQPPAQRLLLVIDQFEELFTQADRDERRRFFELIQVLRELPRCVLISAMRADFYADLMTSDLWPIPPSQRLEIAPLRGLYLRQAIEHPARDMGVRLEAGLIERLLADAADEPGVLPLVQETMVLLWDQMVGHTLPMRAYEELGREGNSGLAVAVTSRADAVLAELTAPQHVIARRIFLRLIQFGEGRPDTRRQQPLTVLLSANDDIHLFEQTLRHLTDSRLLTITGEERDASRKVDIAHESLISSWPTLQQWRVEWREAEQLRRRLDARVTEWVRRGQGSLGLLDEPDLSEAQSWLSSSEASVLGYDTSLPALVERSLSQQERLAELQEQFTVVRSDHDLMAAMLASMPEGMMVIESNGHVAIANAALHQHCGLSPQATQNMDLDQFLAAWKKSINYVADDWIALQQGLERVMQGHATIARGELNEDRTDSRTLEWTVQPTPRKDSGPGGILLTLRDITESKEAERLVQDYTGLLIHDLRAPLTSIINGVMMVKRGVGGPVTEAQTQLLDIAYRGGQAMLDLLNNLLDISRMEQRRLNLDLEPAAANSIIDKAIERLQAAASSKQIALAQQVANDLPLVEVDVDQIVRALQNIIDNAIKFSSSGSDVTVGADFYSHQHALPNTIPVHAPFTDGEWLVFWVHDRGPGIPVSYQGRIFAKFGQIHGRKVHGAGLGLTFCKLAVEAHGGRIWLESEEGHGSTFSFALPVAAG
jgi:PAS domain S-box-containing protein